MANDRLQDLIETLKKQGVECGEKAAQEITETARKKAEAMITEAKAQSALILTQAKEEAERQMKRLQSSMEIAASQFVNKLKAVIEENFISIPLQKEITGELSDPEFLKSLITKFVEAYAANPQHEQIQLLLPKGAQKELIDFAVELMGKHYGAGQGGGRMVLDLEAQDLKFGFQIGKKDGKIRLDFSDDAFLSLFLGFLSPNFREFFRNIKIGDSTKK